MSRSRILCVIDDLGSGGAQRQLVEIALFLCQIGYDVEFLVYKPENSLEPILRQQGVKVIRVPLCGFFSRIYRMRKIIRGGNYNLVVAFRRTPAFICEVAGLPKRNWKLVVSERSSRRKKAKTLLGRFYPYFHKFADCIICNTFTNSTVVMESNPQIKTENVHVIYNCHDFSNWRQPRPVPTETDSSTLRMVIAARVSDMSQLKVLMDAMLHLTPQERAALRVEWYNCGSKEMGSPELLESFNQQIQQKRLHLFVRRAPFDMNEMIADSDIVGLFSFSEKLPRELCSAMASGKPIISANVSDLPLLVEDGRGGFLCDASDHLSVASALHKMIKITNSQRHEMGRYNTQRAHFLFSNEHTIQHYVVLFQKLMNNYST